jgi:hypothetical protein
MEPTPRQQAALDAYWMADTAQEERDAYARMRWLGLPPCYDEPPDMPNPPGWDDLENVR